MNKDELREYIAFMRRSTNTGEGNYITTRDYLTTDLSLGKQLILALKQLPKGSRVLEIGVGQAVTLRELRSLFPHLQFVGTNLFQRKVDGTPSGIVQAEGSALPFKKGHFDLVFSAHAFQYVPDKTKVLKEVHRVLKRGGMALIHSGKPAYFSVKRKNETRPFNDTAKGEIEHHNAGPYGTFLTINKRRRTLHLPIELSLENSWRERTDSPRFHSVYVPQPKRRSL